MSRFSTAIGQGPAGTAGRRLLLITALAVLVLFGVTGTAFAGTVKVNLKAHSGFFTMVGSHRNAAQIIVYGPSGYYRSTTVCGQSSLAQIGTLPVSFTCAPIGPYRVRVNWFAGNGTAAQWAPDWYPSIGWWLWEQNPSRDFTSP